MNTLGFWKQNAQLTPHILRAKKKDASPRLIK